jgi:L-asparaginase/beta-aspartyl-peptidase (threonine type)
VAALQGFKSPMLTARAVMERTHHVMLAGEGAAMFAAEQGLEAISGDPGQWFTHAGADEDNHATGARLTHGTVGCAVLDREGRLAAGTSTGGVFDKMPGRVGDTPVIGAGTWADDVVAVSSTGSGEFFLRTATAVQVAHRMRWAGQDLAAAAEAAIASVGALGGDGGLIAVDRHGRIAMPYNSQGMKRAALHPDGRITSAAFED